MKPSVRSIDSQTPYGYCGTPFAFLARALATIRGPSCGSFGSSFGMRMRVCLNVCIRVYVQMGSCHVEMSTSFRLFTNTTLTYTRHTRNFAHLFSTRRRLFHYYVRSLYPLTLYWRKHTRFFKSFAPSKKKKTKKKLNERKRAPLMHIWNRKKNHFRYMTYMIGSQIKY